MFYYKTSEALIEWSFLHLKMQSTLCPLLGYIRLIVMDYNIALLELHYKKMF